MAASSGAGAGGGGREAGGRGETDGAEVWAAGAPRRGVTVTLKGQAQVGWQRGWEWAGSVWSDEEGTEEPRPR
ncbi:hypothetical protein HPG69_019647 [Diceros bicornis minor]|uniref:Uncharacterized protein n=1 Tax=Diceros bicornis minor TaxID=77932 RepID=A0A7J7E6G1_DICBM|nr:hypothetical protein HPG69_019647 [Diceros bicornis minor]